MPNVGLWADNILDPVKSGMVYHQAELLRAIDAIAEPDEYTVFYTPRSYRQPFPMSFRHLATRRLPGIRHVYYPLWHAFKEPRVERFLGDVKLLHLLHASVTVPTQRAAIVWIVDLASARMKSAFPGRRRWFKDTAIKRAAANPRVTFTANSEFVKGELCSLYDVDPRRVDVVYLGVNKERFSRKVGPEQAARIRKRYGISRPFFLFVGLLSPRKNVDVLIRGFSRFRSVSGESFELVLAGGEGWDYRPIRELAERTDGVLPLGFVPDEDLPALYSLSEAFVFPSAYEGFGLPLVEAMASGTAVITSNVTSLPEVVGDAGLLLPEVSPEAVADSLLRIASDPALQEDLIHRGARRVGEFTWATAAERCVALHRERLAEHS